LAISKQRFEKQLEKNHNKFFQTLLNNKRQFCNFGRLAEGLGPSKHQIAIDNIQRQVATTEPKAEKDLQKEKDFRNQPNFSIR